MTQADTSTPGLQTIAIIGAGAWGTALANVAAQAGRTVLLWAREPEAAQAINTIHENSLFLPGIPLNPAIEATNDLARAATANALLLVVPAQHIRAVMTGLAPSLSPGTPVVICAKGIEQKTNRLLSQILQEVAPHIVPAVLSGPSFAADVAKGLPTAVTLACADPAVADRLTQSLGLPTFRPYWTTDLIGAQIGGAVKNVLAIACGVVEGRRLGDSARAAITTRGFAEITRLGLALGARAETLTGLSGLGDLILTCTSRQSRNMSLGVALGEGQTLDEILAERKSVSEGIYTATAVRELGKRHHLDMPIAAAVAAIVTGETTIDDAIQGLLTRPFTSETHPFARES